MGDKIRLHLTLESIDSKPGSFVLNQVLTKEEQAKRTSILAGENPTSRITTQYVKIAGYPTLIRDDEVVILIPTFCTRSEL